MNNIKIYKNSKYNITIPYQNYWTAYWDARYNLDINENKYSYFENSTRARYEYKKMSSWSSLVGNYSWSIPNIDGYVYTESSGIVTLEAKNYYLNKQMGFNNWYTISDGYSFSGQSITTFDDAFGADIEQSAHEVNYAVNFTTIGRYNFWINGRSLAANPGGTDSIHGGIDDIYLGASQVAFFTTSNGWTRQRFNSFGNAYIDVDTAGVHIIQIKTRESGIIFDRIHCNTATTTPTTPSESSKASTSISQSNLLPMVLPIYSSDVKRAVRLDTKYLTCDDLSSIMNGNDKTVTVILEAAIRSSTGTPMEGDYTLVSFNSSSNDAYCQFGVSSNQYLFAIKYDGITMVNAVRNTSTVTMDTPFIAAFVSDGTNIKISLNGSSFYTTSFNVNSISVNQFTLGGIRQNNFIARTINGYVNRVAISDRVFSEQEVQNVYNAWRRGA
jgi:hypothetical protein